MLVKDHPPPAFLKQDSRAFVSQTSHSPLPTSHFPPPPPRPWPLHSHPAFDTAPAHDWCVLLSFFNPAGFRRPIYNLAAALDWYFGHRIPVYAIELAYHDAAYVLPENHAHVIQLRGCEECIYFAKEPLLQRLATRGKFPAQVTKFFLADADVRLSDPAQFIQAAALLDHARLVQPFTIARWESPFGGSAHSQKHGMAWAATCPDPQPEAVSSLHFHPGFCVGLRRDFFREVPLLAPIDCIVTGDGDTALWQAALAPHMAAPFQGQSHYTAPGPQEWRDAVERHVGARVACTPGDIIHFYHGSFAGRSYVDRHHLLRQLHPRHITWDPGLGLPTWRDAQHLIDAMKAYFVSREEDEVGVAAAARPLRIED